MSRSIPRRSFLASAPLLFATAPLLDVLRPAPASAQSTPAATPSPGVSASFPSQDPARVKEMVGASHGNIARVRELLAGSPDLAKAAWDWGFGDWETALGAASHVGNREMADLLIANGARPDLFTFAMFGQLDIVKAYVTANPGIQKIPGPHGLTLLHHARKGGDEAKAVVEYLESVGDADPRPEQPPLSEEVLNNCAGKYAFAEGDNGALEVTLKDGLLWIRRLPDGSNRSLFHVGDRAFFPAGAPAVRVRFAGTGPAVTELFIDDGPASVAARRLAG